VRLVAVVLFAATRSVALAGTPAIAQILLLRTVPAGLAERSGAHANTLAAATAYLPASAFIASAPAQPQPSEGGRRAP